MKCRYNNDDHNNNCGKKTNDIIYFIAHFEENVVLRIYEPPANMQRTFWF
jgi:hypothetical protein